MASNDFKAASEGVPRETGWLNLAVGSLGFRVESVARSLHGQRECCSVKMVVCRGNQLENRQRKRAGL